MGPEHGAVHDEQPGATLTAGHDLGALLRAGEQRYQEEYGRAPYGMIVASVTPDQPCAYLAVNDAYCVLTGYSQQDLIGRDFLGDFHPEEQPALEVLVRQAESGAGREFRAEARLLRSDGDTVSVRLTGSLVQPPAGEHYLVTYVEDARVIEQARAEIHQLQLELHRSRRLESIGQLVAGIAHDFNNMLTVISNYASLVRDEVAIAEATEGTSKWGPVRWDVDQITDAADRATRLIRHLLATAQKEQGKPQTLDIGQLVNDVTRLMEQVLGEDIPVVTRQGAGLWPVEVDPGLLEQAIISVMLNARAAMPAGGQVTIETANIDMSSAGAAGNATDRQDLASGTDLPPGHYVEIRITDTGTGMDEVTAERAFEPFFTTKGGDQAAGLGLSAVRMFATRAGGAASLQTAPGTGTTVTVTLPIVHGQAPGPADRAGAASPQTVLVVDDEAAIRSVAHRILTSAGYAVVTASSGQEALSLLRDPGTLVDLVLTDVIMPGLTVRAFAAQLQELRPGLQVLFMSGYERPGDLAGSQPDPGAPVIAKPFSRAALLARVAQVITADLDTRNLS